MLSMHRSSKTKGEQEGMEVSGRRERGPHVIAVAFPLMGHVTPLVQLCNILVASAGCRVTIACYYKLVSSLRPLIPQAFLRSGHATVLPFWSELTEDWPNGCWDVQRRRLYAVMEWPPSSFTQHLESFQADPSVACILSDSYLTWTQDAADKLAIPRLALSVSSPAEYQVFFCAKDLMEAGRLPFKAPLGRTEEYEHIFPGTPGRPPAYHRVDEILANEEPIVLSGLPPLNRRDFPTFLQIEDPSDEFYFLHIEHAIAASRAQMLLVNTFEAMEGKLLDIMRLQGIPIHAIGPLVVLEDATVKEQDSVHDGIALACDAGHQDSECLQWLDAQKPKSVIYVAFGTIITLSISQLKELGAGLLDAGQPFILAYAKREGGDAESAEQYVRMLAEQGQGQRQGKGLVLEWAPQKLILRHPAVGAFLSHCGWNSSIESISAGVPMLCLPFLTDQYLQCKLIVEDWKVGMRLEKTEEGVARSEQISRLICEMLVGEAGKGLQQRAHQLKISAEQAIQPAGSSYAAVDAIVKLISKIHS